VTVDSTYEGYNPGPLTDGKINPKTDDWTQVAWASQDAPTDHWVQLDFPQPRKTQQVTIHWAWDNGAYFTSRKLVLEIKQGNTWTPVEATATSDDKGTQTTLTFGPLEAAQLRIRQPAGAGPITRPDIMWVTELEVR